MGRTLTELLTWEYLDKMAQLSHGKKNRGNTSKVLRSPSEPLIVLIEEIRALSIRKGIFCVCFIGTLLITGAKEIKAETSHASWYGPQHHGRMMASGFRFDMHTLVVAHRTHRFGTLIRLTRHTRDNRELSVVVRVCDRGPYVAGRTLDVSYAAARVLEFDRAGTALLRVEILYSPRSTEEVREARASCGTPLFF